MSLKEFLIQNPKQKLIFDFDETIVKLKIPWHEYRRGIVNLAAKFDKTMADSWTGSGNALTNQIVTYFGQEAKKEFDKYTEEFEMNNLEGYENNDELLNFIDEHATNYDFSIFSSNTEMRILSILEEIGITSIFKKIVSKDKVLLTKPSPDGFYQLYSPQTDHKQDYIMIGDSEHSDGGMAKIVGIDFFKVDYFQK